MLFVRGIPLNPLLITTGRSFHESPLSSETSVLRHDELEHELLSFSPGDVKIAFCCDVSRHLLHLDSGKIWVILIPLNISFHRLRFFKIVLDNDTASALGKSSFSPALRGFLRVILLTDFL